MKFHLLILLLITFSRSSLEASVPAAVATRQQTEGQNADPSTRTENVRNISLDGLVDTKLLGLEQGRSHDETRTFTRRAGDTRTSTRRAGNTRTSTIRAGNTRTSTILAGDTRTSTILAGDTRTSTRRAGDTRTSTILAGDTRTSTRRAGDTRTSTILAGDRRTSTILAGDRRTSTRRAGDRQTSTRRAGDTRTSTIRAEDTRTSTRRAGDTRTSTKRPAATRTTVKRRPRARRAPLANTPTATRDCVNDPNLDNRLPDAQCPGAETPSPDDVEYVDVAGTLPTPVRKSGDHNEDLFPVDEEDDEYEYDDDEVSPDQVATTGDYDYDEHTSTVSSPELSEAKQEDYVDGEFIEETTTEEVEYVGETTTSGTVTTEDVEYVEETTTTATVTTEEEEVEYVEETTTTATVTTEEEVEYVEETTTSANVTTEEVEYVEETTTSANVTTEEVEYVEETTTSANVTTEDEEYVEETTTSATVTTEEEEYVEETTTSANVTTEEVEYVEETTTSATLTTEEEEYTTSAVTTTATEESDESTLDTTTEYVEYVEEPSTIADTTNIDYYLEETSKTADITTDGDYVEETGTTAGIANKDDYLEEAGTKADITTDDDYVEETGTTTDIANKDDYLEEVSTKADITTDGDYVEETGTTTDIANKDDYLEEVSTKADITTDDDYVEETGTTAGTTADIANKDDYFEEASEPSVTTEEVEYFVEMTTTEAEYSYEDYGPPDDADYALQLERERQMLYDYYNEETAAEKDVDKKRSKVGKQRSKHVGKQRSKVGKQRSKHVEVKLEPPPRVVVTEDPELTTAEYVDAEEGMFPWVVSFKSRHDVVGRWSGHCMGTLVEPSWVVTAAHCFLQEETGEDLIVYAGNVDFSRIPERQRHGDRDASVARSNGGTNRARARSHFGSGGKTSTLLESTGSVTPEYSTTRTLEENFTDKPSIASDSPEAKTLNSTTARPGNEYRGVKVTLPSKVSSKSTTTENLTDKPLLASDNPEAKTLNSTTARPGNKYRGVKVTLPSKVFSKSTTTEVPLVEYVDDETTVEVICDFGIPGLDIECFNSKRSERDVIELPPSSSDTVGMTTQSLAAGIFGDQARRTRSLEETRRRDANKVAQDVVLQRRKGLFRIALQRKLGQSKDVDNGGTESSSGQGGRLDKTEESDKSVVTSVNSGPQATEDDVEDSSTSTEITYFNSLVETPADNPEHFLTATEIPETTTENSKTKSSDDILPEDYYRLIDVTKTTSKSSESELADDYLEDYYAFIATTETTRTKTTVVSKTNTPLKSSTKGHSVSTVNTVEIPYVNPQTSPKSVKIPYVKPQTTKKPVKIPYVNPKTTKKPVKIPYVNPKTISKTVKIPYVNPQTSPTTGRPKESSSTVKTGNLAKNIGPISARPPTPLDPKLMFQERKVSQIIVHPDFYKLKLDATKYPRDHVLYQFDVALLRLETPFDVSEASPVKTIELTYHLVEETVSCKVLGWGTPNDGAKNLAEINGSKLGVHHVGGAMTAGRKLKYAEIQLKKKSECNMTIESVHSQLLCVEQVDEGTSKTCVGDAGSPLICGCARLRRPDQVTEEFIGISLWTGPRLGCKPDTPHFLWVGDLEEWITSHVPPSSMARGTQQVLPPKKNEATTLNPTMLLLFISATCYILAHWEY